MSSVAVFRTYFESEAARLRKLLDAHREDEVGPSARRSVKITAVAMLDLLARVRKPAQNRSMRRFRAFVREFCDWDEMHLVSLPVLKERLGANGTPLLNEIDRRMASLPLQDAGGLPLGAVDLPPSKLQPLATTQSERKALGKAVHLRLLYELRNFLVHESRTPGGGWDLALSDDRPGYHTYIGSDDLCLCYPATFILGLVESGSAKLCDRLAKDGIDPYARLKDSRSWLQAH